MSYYYLLFLIFACFFVKERAVWGILFLTGVLLHLNSILMTNEHGSFLYYNRVIITFSASLFLLKFCKTLHAYYQSSVYTLTLILFLLLEYDVVTGENIIYDSYEDCIHGSIIVKFLGLFIPHCRKVSTCYSYSVTHTKLNSTNN